MGVAVHQHRRGRVEGRRRARRTTRPHGRRPRGRTVGRAAPRSTRSDRRAMRPSSHQWAGRCRPRPVARTPAGSGRSSPARQAAGARARGGSDRAARGASPARTSRAPTARRNLDHRPARGPARCDGTQRGPRRRAAWPPSGRRAVRRRPRPPRQAGRTTRYAVPMRRSQRCAMSASTSGRSRSHRAPTSPPDRARCRTSSGTSRPSGKRTPAGYCMRWQRSQSSQIFQSRVIHSSAITDSATRKCARQRGSKADGHELAAGDGVAARPGLDGSTRSLARRR